MPIIKSAIKRMKQTAKRRARNIELKQNIKTAVKAFRAKPSGDALSNVQRQYDTAVKKKLLKKNTASRRKAQIAKEAKVAGVKLAATKKKTATKSSPKEATNKKPVTKKTATKKASAKKKTT